LIEESGVLFGGIGRPDLAGSNAAQENELAKAIYHVTTIVKRSNPQNMIPLMR